MSEKYKVFDSKIPHFITLTVVGWVDVFIRNNYTEILDNSLKFCIEKKDLKVMAYVYMTNHMLYRARLVRHSAWLCRVLNLLQALVVRNTTKFITLA